MLDEVTVTVDGNLVRVPLGSTALAAVFAAGQSVCRTSVTGEPRGPLCGMGVCYECRTTIDGVAHVRACMARCRDGMEIITH